MMCFQEKWYHIRLAIVVGVFFFVFCAKLCATWFFGFETGLGLHPPEMTETPYMWIEKDMMEDKFSIIEQHDIDDHPSLWEKVFGRNDD